MECVHILLPAIRSPYNDNVVVADDDDDHDHAVASHVFPFSFFSLNSGENICLCQLKLVMFRGKSVEAVHSNNIRNWIACPREFNCERESLTTINDRYSHYGI